jgi:hypothetical protein
MVPNDAISQATWQLFDDLLAELGPEGCLEHFFLDGHLATLEDYSNVHPGAEQTLRDLTSTGRLGLGPCQVLMDEHASSGETIIHNLQAGYRWATHLGEKPRVALLPPAWGHVPQLPQLLRLSGTDHVVIMAGPWLATTMGAFWWRAPDGSSVRAECRQSHGCGGYQPGTAEGAPGAAGEPAMAPGEDNFPGGTSNLFEWLADVEEGLARDLGVPGEALLWLHHADLSGPASADLTAQVRSLANLVRVANSGQDKYRFRVTTVDAYFETARQDGLPSITGELRPEPPGTHGRLGWDGAFSGRLDLAAAATAAERALEGLAEPLCALWLAPEDWPEADFRLAWDQLVRNGGWRLGATSQGRALQQSMNPAPYRASSFGHSCAYTQVAHVAAAAQRHALAAAARALRDPGTVVLNPSPRARSGIVEVREQHAGGTTGQPLGDARSLVWMDDVPGYGWATVAPGSEVGTTGRGPGTPVRSAPSDLAGPSLDNGLVHLSVSRVDGSYAVNGHWGLGHLVDEADAGDVSGYRRPTEHGPEPARAGGDGEEDGRPRRLPDEGGAVQRPDYVEVRAVEQGPCRGRITVVRRYPWTSMAPEVRTELELRAGENFIRVTMTFFNQRPGHRLRTVLALPARADRSVADCAFATSERPAHPVASYPTKSFACAGGVIVAHDGLGEYTVGSDGWALALTLLRSTLSSDFAASAGEATAASAATRAEWETGSQLGPWSRAWSGPEQLGHHVVRYALAVGAPGQGPAGGIDPWQVAEDAFVPLQVVESPGGGSLTGSGSHLQVKGGRVSSLRRQGDVLEVRLFNPSPEPVLVEIPGQAGAHVDLQGNFLGDWQDSFALAPWSIGTVHIS